MTLDPTTLSIINAIKSNVIVPVVVLMFALAMLYFLWGVVEYIINLDNATKRLEGQGHMFWGVIGLGIMLSVFGIMNFIFNTVTDNGNIKGVDNQAIVAPSTVNNGHF